MFINNTSYDTIWQANHCAACVYRRFFTVNEIACGGWLAFHVCSRAYLIIIFFGNQANGSGLISVGFRVQHKADTLRCRYGKPVSRRMRTLLHSMWETHDIYSTSLSFATCLDGDLLRRSLKLVINWGQTLWWNFARAWDIYLNRCILRMLEDTFLLGEAI